MDNFTVAICNYNTTQLTNACIASVQKQVGENIQIVVLDNSNRQKFELDQRICSSTNVKIIDNTTGKFIDFAKVVREFGKTFDETHGSLRHAYSIQFLINTTTTQKLVLLDSDVILRKNFADLVAQEAISCFDIGKRKNYQPRALPFIQVFDLPLLKKHRIHYFDPQRIRGGLNQRNSPLYDTGASFLEDVQKSNVQCSHFDFTDYAIHLRSASILQDKIKAEQFLAFYRPFYTTNSSVDELIDCKLIVSLTSYKPRILDGSLRRTLESLTKQKFNGQYKIAVSLTLDDQQHIDADFSAWLKSNSIIILTASQDLKPHTKYFYAMLKWKSLPIVTVDDDALYDDDLLQVLYNGYKEFPDNVIARRTHLMKRDANSNLLPYRQWKYECSEICLNPNKDLFATGVGGVLYPADCLKIDDSLLPEIKKCLNADDVFLKKREQVLGIDVVYVKGKRLLSYSNQQSSVADYALCFKNNTAKRCDNDLYISQIGLK